MTVDLDEARRRSLGPRSPQLVDEPRSPDVFELEPGAMRLKRMRDRVLTWCTASADWYQQSLKRRSMPVMVTCTYSPDQHFCPRDISKLLKCISEWARKIRLGKKNTRGKARRTGKVWHRAPRPWFRVPYVWVLELHKSGRPHYHLLCWIPYGYSLPKCDKGSNGRSAWFAKGSTRTEKVEKSVHGYMCKYLSKFSSDLEGGHEIPAGARICGRGGLPLQSDECRLARHLAYPSWLRSATGASRRPDGRLCTLVRIVKVSLGLNRPPRPLTGRDGKPLITRRGRIRMEPTHSSLRVDCDHVVHFSPYRATYDRNRRVIVVRRKHHVSD